MAQLTKKYDNLSAEYAQLKASHAQQIAEQRAESEQIKASQAQQKVEYEAAYEQQKAEYEAAYEQQKAAYEQFCEMIMNMANSGTCAPNLFWSYNHQLPPGSPSLAPPLY
jgi:phage shock protein A